MTEWLKDLDVNLFLYLNSKHSPAADQLMYWVSYRFTWVPLYILLLWGLVKKEKKAVWLTLVAAAVLITCTDQLSVLIKETVQRYRPCHNLSLQSLVHTLDGKCGGQYGFVSSHAANSFALATFLYLFFRDHSRITGITLLAWALLVCYSRVYSGVHYPLDLAGGAITGIILAAGIYFLREKLKTKIFIR